MILISGGLSYNTEDEGSILRVLSFDPNTGRLSAWTGDDLIDYRIYGAVGAFEGKLIVAGGLSQVSSSDDLGSINRSEVFDPTDGRFVPGPEMRNSRQLFGAASLGW